MFSLQLAGFEHCGILSHAVKFFFTEQNGLKAASTRAVTELPISDGIQLEGWLIKEKSLQQTPSTGVCWKSFECRWYGHWQLEYCLASQIQNFVASFIRLPSKHLCLFDDLL